MLKQRIHRAIFLFPIFIVYTFCLEGKYYKKSRGNSTNISTGLYVKNKNQPTYTLLVQGIECELCKQSVCAILEEVGADPHSVQVTMDEQSRILFSAQSNTKVNIAKLQQKLHKEGFIFKHLTGSFHGKIINIDDQVYFELAQYNTRLNVKNPKPELLQLKSEKFIGEVTYDLSNKHFWFTVS